MFKFFMTSSPLFEPFQFFFVVVLLSLFVLYSVVQMSKITSEMLHFFIIV